MKRKEKIRFFLELLNCNYELHFWQYDKEYHLIETNWNNELFSGDFFSYVGLESLLKKRETEKKWNPVILEAGNNLLWPDLKERKRKYSLFTISDRFTVGGTVF